MDLPALRQLMGAYAHQDYDLLGKTPMQAVDAFLREEPRKAASLPTEIRHVLDILPSEQAVRDLVTGLGCEVLPPTEMRNYRTFLAAIARRASDRPEQV